MRPSGGLIGLYVSGSMYYYLFDGTGSVVGLVDSAGNQVNTYAYEPFGEFSSAPVEGVVQPYKFHGGYFDSAEGFYKMGARYYEPETGRFTQPEPAWTNPMFNTLRGRNLLVARSYGTGATVGQEGVPLPGGYYWPASEYNWYSYAGNDPVNVSDSSGYSWIVFPWWFLAVCAIMVPMVIHLRSFRNQDQEGIRSWEKGPSIGPRPTPRPFFGPTPTPTPNFDWRWIPITPRGPEMWPAPR